MSNLLSQIKRGSELPLRILLSGPEGIGKTSWAAKAPSPLFIAPEDGLTSFEYLPRYTPGTLDDLNAFLTQLKDSKSEYKTLVVDTVDWLERLIHRSICARDGKRNIEDYGYGKGQSIATGEMVGILQKLDALRTGGMCIVLLSHVHIKTFSSPSGIAWDRYEMKGSKSFTGILREWPDACLFAVWDVAKAKREGRDIAIGGERIVHTEWSVGWDAKNRLNLPAILPMDYDAFDQAVKDNSPSVLRAKIREALKDKELTDGQRKWLATIDSQPSDKLRSVLEKLTGK